MSNTRQELRRKRTLAEKILWGRIRNKQLGYRFRRQYSIGNYVIDFYCPELKLGIEIDGKIHLRKIDMDKYREKTILTVGVKLVRFKNEEVFESIGDVVDKIKKILPLE